MSDAPQPDFKHVKIHMADGEGDLARYQQDNAKAHAAIMEELRVFGKLSAVLKVLGVLVLALVGAVAGFIAGGANWIGSLEDQIHEVEMAEKANTREDFAITRSLQKEVNALQVAVAECQRRHGIRPGKDE